RIVAQVEDDALGGNALALLVDIVDGLLDADIGLLGEAAETEQADIALHAPGHRAHGDDVARQLELLRLLAAFADYGELDLGADRAAHLLDRLVEGHAQHLLAVELDDVVVRQDA